MVAGMVEELGHRVAAEGGSVLEACLVAETAEYDLAMLDINLGGHDVGPVARGLPVLVGQNLVLAGGDSRLSCMMLSTVPIFVVGNPDAIPQTIEVAFRACL